MVECLAEIVDQWLGAVLPASSSDIGLMAANLCLDLIELTDTLQQIGGERGRLGRMNVEYIAPELRPASHLGDTGGVEELAIAGIAIGLQITGEHGQLPLGMFHG